MTGLLDVNAGKGRRTEPYRAMLVPGSHIGWVGLRSLISGESEVVIVGEDRNPDTAVQLAQQLQPDAILMDAEPESFPGPTLAHRFQARCPDAKVLVFAARTDGRVVRAMAEMNVACFIPWDEVPPDDMRYVLRAVLAGNLYVSSRDIVRDMASATESKGRVRQRLSGLSERECEILDCLAEGMSERKVAVETGIPLRSVERLVSRLEEDLGFSSLIELRTKVRDLGFGC